MDIIDWFDPTNIEHLKAYEYLQDKGFWKAGFLPKDMEFCSCWESRINSRITSVHIKEKLEKEIDTIEIPKELGQEFLNWIEYVRKQKKTKGPVCTKEIHICSKLTQVIEDQLKVEKGNKDAIH